MAEYDNTNTGILARNDKQGNEKRPDYRGSLNVGGVEYWISGWLRDGREGSKLAGQKYLSLKVEAKEAKQPAPTRHETAKANAYVEDDIPFD